MRLLSICVVSLSVVCAPLPAATAERPLAVSPGSTGQLANLAESCPTFSWAGVPTASAYRLIVYEVTSQGSLGQAIVQRVIPGGATTWSAPLGQCLARGGTYAWTVGASSGKGEAAWSDPVLFRIAPGPTEAQFEQALAVVQSYLASRSEGNASASADESPDVAIADGLDEASADAAPAAPAGTVFSADGNVDATSFSGNGAMLTNLTPGNIAAGTAAIDISGSAATATAATSATTAAALATNPTDCPAGQFATTIDASGNLTCAPDGGIDHGFATRNTRIGESALAANTTGSQNTASGYKALRYNTTGLRNTADGSRALYSNTTGNYNTATGTSAMLYNSTGPSNTATGDSALRNNTTGRSNTASGNFALRDNTTGSYNTASGQLALNNNTTSSHNTADGHRALVLNTTGYRNTAVGSGALETNTTGYSNTASGYQALLNSTGNRNTALGQRAGRNATTGSDNIFIANEAVAGDDSKIRIGTQGTQTATYVAGVYGSPLAGSNVVVMATGQLGTGPPPSAGFDTITTGTNTSATMTVGTGASLVTSGSGTIAATTSGSATALATDGSNCAANEAAGGVDASGNAQDCRDQADLTAFATDNTRVGSGALSSNTTGERNTAIGDQALSNNTEGWRNTAAGHRALSSNTTGHRNSAFGWYALRQNTGGENTAIGNRALAGNTTGSGNVAAGSETLSWNTTGQRNTATGENALHYNTTGRSNTAAGAWALYGNTTGRRNIALGYRAGEDATTGDDNIFIGNLGAPADAAKIKIGTEGTQTATYVAGIHGTSLAGNAVVVTSSGQLGVASGATGDADTLDGLDSTDFATDTELATHAGLPNVHHTPTTDTTCTGAACDGANFTNVTAVAGDSATAFFSTGQIEEPRIASEIARDSEVTALGGTVWSQTGNAGTDATINFLGTTDNQPLELRSNSTRLLRLALDSVSHPHPSPNTPLDIPDNSPPGLTDALTVGDLGNAVSLSVSVNLTNSDISTIKVELTAPDATPYVLYDGGSTGTTLNTSFPSPTATVSGDLTTWVGSNPTGAWTLKVIDSGFLNNGFDGQLLDWSINFDTQTDPNAQVLGRLDVAGSLGVGEIASSGAVNAAMFFGDGSGLTNVAALTAATATSATSASTATALAADGTNCPAGQWAAGVDASGNSQGCTADGGINHGFAIKNTSVGSNALASSTTGYYNTASGYRALYANTEGSSNTASGMNALSSNTTGDDNTANGSHALSYNTEGDRNTANGSLTLVFNTTGSSNTATGFVALQANTTGSQNTAIGDYALHDNTTGGSNTASGVRALKSNTIGFNNTASGIWALADNTTGSFNTATGGFALATNTTGERNTAIGTGALTRSTTGYGNTASGAAALYYNTTGSRITALGYRAGWYATTGNDSIFIGSGAEGLAADANTIRIGGTTFGSGVKQQNRAFINGIRGATTGVADAVNVMIDSAGQLGTVSSSRHYKEDIESMETASDRLLALRPVTFHYKEAFADGEKPVQFGLIAEEVAEVFPELVVYNEEGNPETVKYHLLSTLLLNELQKQARLMETQARVNQEQTQLLTKLAALAEGVRDGP